MTLAFEFTYLSHNGVLEAILKEICEDFSIKYTILHEQNHVVLYVEDTKEQLGQFADYLGQFLPLSVFFKSSSVYVADTFPFAVEEILPSTLPITFTPKRLYKSEASDAAEYLLPSINFQKNHDRLSFKSSTKNLEAFDAPSLNKLYDEVVNALCDGECITMYVDDEAYVLGRVEAISQFQEIKESEIIATDLSVVERMVVIRENEIKALATLERPAILCKVNAFYAQKNILPMQRVWLRLSDGLWMHHVCKRLFAKRVQFLFKIPLQSFTPTDTILKSSTNLAAAKPFRICVLENGEIMILQGTHFATKALAENRQKFDEPSHATFASIMQEHQLFESKVSCFYLSMTHDDAIMNYSKEHGMLDLTRVGLPASFGALFEEIANSSKSAARLIEHYKEQYFDIYQNALNTPIPIDSSKSIFTLWKMVAIVLGLSKEWTNGGRSLIEYAEDFGGQKGPRIDYFLQKEDALVADLDYVRLIRSGISFKLAGTDDATLSFGYMQSLAYFISDMSDHYKESLENESIALAGSLFGCRRLSEMVYKNLKPNHRICFNLELPIDHNI